MIDNNVDSSPTSPSSNRTGRNSFPVPDRTRLKSHLFHTCKKRRQVHNLPSEDNVDVLHFNADSIREFFTIMLMTTISSKYLTAINRTSILHIMLTKLIDASFFNISLYLCAVEGRYPPIFAFFSTISCIIPRINICTQLRTLEDVESRIDTG